MELVFIVMILGAIGAIYLNRKYKADPILCKPNHKWVYRPKNDSEFLICSRCGFEPEN